MSRKKLKLEKRSHQSARIHKGLEMPVGMGSEDSILGFRNGKELKEKYFAFQGRIARRPFIMRTLLLIVAQFMFTFILYSKIVESIIIHRTDFAWGFGILLIVLTIPTVWSQLSLGWRRCHDMNKGGAFFYHSVLLLFRQLCSSHPGTGYAGDSCPVHYSRLFPGLFHRTGNRR